MLVSCGSLVLTELHSTDPRIDERRLWEKDLVRFYLAQLQAFGGPKISEEEAWTHIKIQSFTVSLSALLVKMKSTPLCFVGAGLLDSYPHAKW